MIGDEKIIKLIKKLCKTESPIVIAEMNTDDSLKIHDLIIEKEMLYFLELSNVDIAKKVNGEIAPSGGETHAHSFIDRTEYLKRIKKGDKVAVCKLSNKMYLVLGRVV